MDLHGVLLKMMDNVVGPRLRSLYRVIVPEKNMLPSEAFLKESQAGILEHETTKSHTGDPTVMSQLTRWMEACKSHPRCSSNTVTRHLPTRLIDLSPPTGIDMFRVWSTTEDSHVPYCTLSHCSGDGKGILKLEKSTFESLYAGRRKAALPLTFRQAMTVCLELGIRHIWIDSLCIIQDDTSNWESESQRMSDIYANAQCNIAATANAHAHLRLFRERSLNVIRPMQVDISAKPHGSLDLPAGRYSLFDLQLWSSNVKD
ncbi:hypothetical protein M409DRAFT_30749 [Zasmidium cellare ATCC 36951]|uniref:Heterokaryon incompatibility domain-containing protein n=1 Tax=Zasmidium cellare ATCC 36951 TaxID=1080233 RepID=A0A6A6BYX9_ZASCE|nr:uncharacterized protein M409DRAFT_30749 [Zasmidium cellare ATCC 36951]KAF2158792.1 hypothetical protein M409DRAFT_30749 [Zasmidium cellare ATCC 36951]